MGKIVRAFSGNDEPSRQLNRAANCGKDVTVLTNVPLAANMTFTYAKLMYHEEPGPIHGRPYLHLAEGKITSVTGDMPYDVVTARFTERNAPVIAVDWELLNSEIANITQKGGFGSDWDIDPEGPSGKPKDTMKVPTLFTEVEWEGIPIRADIMAMETDDGIPVISINPVKPFELKTNSRVSGYDDISQYFQPQELYQAGQSVDKSNMFIQLSEEDTIGAEHTIIAEVEDDKNIIRAEEVKSVEEQEEDKKRAALMHEINQRTELYVDETQIDDTSKLEADVDANIKDSDNEESKEYADSDAFSEDMLADMHLVDTNNADKDAAAAKIAEQAVKRSTQAQAKAIAEAEAEARKAKNESQISEAMSEGERAMRNEASDSKNGPSIAE